jgi:hypothetical protein
MLSYPLPPLVTKLNLKQKAMVYELIQIIGFLIIILLIPLPGAQFLASITIDYPLAQKKPLSAIMALT